MGSTSSRKPLTSWFARHRRRPVAVLALLVTALVSALMPPSASAGTTTTGAPPRAEALAPTSAGEAPIGVVSNLGVGVTRPEGIAAGPDGALWFVNRKTVDGTGGWLSHVTVGGAITHLPPSPVALGGGIALGADGNLWATGTGAILRVTAAGVTTVFADPAVGSARGIVAGPDGALWFADETNNAIGRITTAGELSRFEAPGIVAPTAIVAADDGLWFNSGTTATLGQITPAGAVTVVGGAVAKAALAAGPDGHAWFAGSSMVGRVTAAGVDLVPIADLGFGYTSYGPIASGSDGNLWVGITDRREGRSHMLRITPEKVVTPFVTEPVDTLAGMGRGPDGAVWFTTKDNLIGSIAPDGVATLHRGSWVNGPGSIKASPDGDLVFANRTGSSIGRVSTTGAFSHIFGPTPFPGESDLTTANLGQLDVGSEGSIWFVAPGELRRLPPGGGMIERHNQYHYVQYVATVANGDAWATSNETEPLDFCFCRTTDSVIRFSGDDGYVYGAQSAGWWEPRQITAGPDGNVWFIASKFLSPTMMLVKGVSTGGVVPIEVPGVASIDGLTAGPDGNIWFTSGAGHTVGRMTPAGVTTLFPSGSLSPRAITTGPDGNLWFTTLSGHEIGRITPQGEVASVTDPSIDVATSITSGPDGGLWFTNEGTNSIGHLAMPPSPPTNVVATAGTSLARVSWTAGAAGGSPVTHYVVTASPGGAACTSDGALSCTVRGLTAGLAYTFSVTATNAVGTSAASPASAAVTPGRGGGYHPLTPVRILDSRTATGSWSGALAASAPRELRVVGAGGASAVPETAAAVVMNVTATGSTENSFLTAWPTGSPRPGSSNLNFAVGETIPNLVTVALGAAGTVSFATAVGSVHVVADVVGYYDDGTVEGDRFTGVAPVRLLDSRTTVGGWARPLVAGQTHDLLVRQPTNAMGVPATATAVAVNVTATEGSAASFLSVRPSGTTAGASNLNFAAGQTIPNLVIVKIGADGAITLDNAVGQVDVIVDLVGYFDPTSGSGFHAIEPTRVLDDRVGTGLSGPWGPGQTRTLVVGGAQGSSVPANATGLIANVTATGGTQASFVSVFPHAATRPNSSNLNYGAGQTIPNLVMVGVGTGGAVDLFNAHGSVDLVADAVGYFSTD